MDPQEAYELGLLDNERIPYSTVSPGEDTDGDGLYDAFELEQGLDPFNPDTDGDGIHDHWDLLGSEHIDPRLDGGGFAWFDPSAGEVLEPIPRPSRSRQLFGLYVVPDALTDVIVFGSNRSTPVGFRFGRRVDDAFYGYAEGWRTAPSLLQVLFEQHGLETTLYWDAMHFSCSGGREGYCQVSSQDRQRVTLQTAPVHGQPLPHWGPDPDADGLSVAAELELGSNPLRWDTDYDGIPDGAEVNQDTSPTSIDTDNNGVRDLAQTLRSTPISTGQ